MVGWVFFRAETLPAAIAFLKAMAGLRRRVPTPLHGRLVPDAGARGWRSSPARSDRRRGCRRWRRDSRRRGVERWRLAVSSTRRSPLLLVASILQSGRAHLQPVHLLPILMNARLLRRSLFVVDRSRCRWRRTSPAWTAPIRRRRTANWRRFRSSTRRGRRSRRSARGLGAWFDDHFGFRVDARALVRREPAVRPRRVAVHGGRQGRATAGSSTATTRRSRTTRTIEPLTPEAVANWRAAVVARARLAARARHRVRVHDRAGQARIYPEEMPATIAQVGDRVADRSAVRRRCRTPASPVDVRPALDRRRRRASASISRPTRTGTIAARSSRISRSSTRCARAVPAAPPPWTRDDFDDRSSGASKDWIWRA